MKIPVHTDTELLVLSFQASFGGKTSLSISQALSKTDLAQSRIIPKELIRMKLHEMVEEILRKVP